MCQVLSERFGQPFVVENRPGAGQNIGAESAVRSAPDGYTLLLATTANASNVSLYENMNFNFVRDTSPIAGFLRSSNVMKVHPSLPVHSVPEFIAYAKAKPGKINMASSGNGSTTHLTGALFREMAGVDFVHVPYRGGSPALADLLNGQVQLMFDVLSTSIGLIKEGKLRALAVTMANRSELLPDVPAMREFIPGFEVSSWSGFVGPANMPGEIVEKLNKEITLAFGDPRIKSRVESTGSAFMPMSPKEFGEFIAAETTKWAKVIKNANIKPD